MLTDRPVNASEGRSMCEILGITSERPYNANSLLSVFYTHSQANKDGWGLAVFHGRGVSMEKEPVKALDSIYLKHRLSREVLSRNLVAHIRRATVGQTEYANCHPFVWDDESGRTWTFIHNGTIFIPGCTCNYATRQEGSTDSERLLLYIIDRCNELIREHGAEFMEVPENRFRLIEDIIEEMSNGNKLNLILYDSEYMYVHTNSPGTLHMIHRDGSYIFATKPVSMEDLPDPEWKQVPVNRLLVYRNGEHVWSGHPHGNEYDKSKYNYLGLYL